MSLVMGTGIGGLLAAPALHYPTVFSPTGLFGRCSKQEKEGPLGMETLTRRYDYLVVGLHIDRCVYLRANNK